MKLEQQRSKIVSHILGNKSYRGTGTPFLLTMTRSSGVLFLLILSMLLRCFEGKCGEPGEECGDLHLPNCCKEFHCTDSLTRTTGICKRYNSTTMHNSTSNHVPAENHDRDEDPTFLEHVVREIDDLW